MQGSWSSRILHFPNPHALTLNSLLFNRMSNHVWKKKAPILTHPHQGYPWWVFSAVLLHPIFGRKTDIEEFWCSPWSVIIMILASFFVNTWWELGTLIVPLLQNYLEFSIALSSLIELLPTKCGNKLMKKSWTIGMKISHNLLICVCGGTCDSTLKVDKRSVVHCLELQQEKRCTVPYLTLHSWQIDSYHYRFPLVKEWCPSQQLSASILPRCSDHKD